MSFPVLARLIAAALHDPAHDMVEFIWHGGETTVLPISFYERALLLQSRLRRPDQLIQNSIQTNGTRLTPEWIEFLRAYEFGVGISLDGPPQVHDRHRRYASGRGSFGDVMRGIRLLQEYRIPFGVLMVIDEEALELGPDRIFDFFLEFGIQDFGLLAARPTNMPNARLATPIDHYVEPARMNEFLRRMYDRWLEHGDSEINIREIESLRTRISGRDGFCTLEGGCLGKYFLVEPNGEVAHCDLFVGDERYTLGNICTDNFATLRSSPKLAALQEENERALESMRECPEFQVCNGWCPHERYVSLRHNRGHQADCCGLRDLIEHIRDGMQNKENPLHTQQQVFGTPQLA